MEYGTFVRSSSEGRVVESAMNWIQGFHGAKQNDKSASTDGYAYLIILQYEGDDINNTLNHALCAEFEDGKNGDISVDA